MPVDMEMDDKSSKVAAARKRLENFRKKKGGSDLSDGPIAPSKAVADGPVSVPSQNGIKQGLAPSHTPVTSVAPRMNGPLSPVAEASPLPPRAELARQPQAHVANSATQRSLWTSMPDIARSEDIVPLPATAASHAPSLQRSLDAAHANGGLVRTGSAPSHSAGSPSYAGSSVAPTGSAGLGFDRSLSAGDLIAGIRGGVPAGGVPVAAAAGSGLSSTDRLRQLTQRLNNLAADSRAVTPGGRVSPSPSPSPSASESVLVGKIQQLTLERDQLKRSLEELQRAHAQQPSTSQPHLQRQIESLQHQLQQLQVRSESDRRALEQQLHIHTQTIDILVEEKNELSAREKAATTRAAEADRAVSQFKSELDAERKRVQSLSSSAANAHSADAAHARLSAAEAELTKLRARMAEMTAQLQHAAEERAKLSSRADDAAQSADELRRKLVAAVAEGDTLRKKNAELVGKLDAADAIMRQMGQWDRSQAPNGDAAPGGAAGGDHEHASPVDVAGELRRVTAERQELQGHLAQAQHTTEQLKAEKREVTAHWKAANERLAAASKQLSEAQQRLASLESQLATAVDERDEAARRLQESKTVAEGLQKELDELSITRRALEDQVAAMMAVAAAGKETAARETAVLREEIEQLRTQISGLEGALAEQADRARRFGEQASDKEGILSRARADADTISRATTQNKELKERLALLEDKFIEMANANAELTDRLSTANHALASERRVREESDGARRAAEALVETLTAQVADARRELELYRAEAHGDEDGHADAHASHPGDPAAAEVVRLRAQVDDLSRQLDAQRSLADSLQHELLEEQKAAQSPVPPAPAAVHAAAVPGAPEATGEAGAGDSAAPAFESLLAENERMREAIEALGRRLNALLEEKQRLVDRIEREEHLNVQLSGEVETIGEYISLYHQERRALRERAVQKDALVAQLASARDEMQEKCGELKALVLRLLAERDGTQTQALGEARPESPSPPPTEGDVTGSGVRKALEELEGRKSPRSNEAVVDILDSIQFGTPALEFRPCSRCSNRLYRV